MNCTEEVAKTKWCTFAQAPIGIEGGHCNMSKNNIKPVDRIKCIASECMAWEWKDRNIFGFCNRA